MSGLTSQELAALQLVAGLSEDLARHVAVALRQHRLHLTDGGDQPPAGYDELLRAVTFRATRGQAGPKFDQLLAAADAEPHDLLSYKQAAPRLAISIRTLKRRIREGKVPVVRDGGPPRIRRSDIDAITGRTTP